MWAAPLQPLVQRHGAAAVNMAGVVALGYPAILCHLDYEIEALKRQLGSRVVIVTGSPETGKT